MRVGAHAVDKFRLGRLSAACYHGIQCLEKIGRLVPVLILALYIRQWLRAALYSTKDLFPTRFFSSGVIF